MLRLLLRQIGLVGLLCAVPVCGVPCTSVAAETPHQIIVVDSVKSSDTTATLSTYETASDGSWQRVLGPVRAFVGADGIGEPQDNVPRTPVGDFALDVAFGRLPNPGTAMPYTQVTQQDWWDENPSSPTYNTMVHQSNSPGGGSENLYNSGPVYDYAVNIAHNPNRTPGKAAGIFLHVTDGSPTLGCVAVDKDSMQHILAWLDPAKDPHIVIGVGAVPPAAVAPAVPATSATAPDNSIDELSTAIAQSLLSGS